LWVVGETSFFPANEFFELTKIFWQTQPKAFKKLANNSKYI
jgi:hypothetical protein